MARRLAVFDFDHTIVDDNSDIVARKLLKDTQIPSSVKALYRSSGWTVYMREIFKLLHKYKISESTVKSAITSIPPVPTMKKLLTTLATNNFDIIVISDANSYFINEWLEAHGLDKIIHSVFTNPAKYNKKGLLEIEMYHIQTTCKLSVVNLCKGMVMEDFVKAQKDNCIDYEQIIYVGDGKNDFCPILRLTEKDIACVRADYACVKLMANAKKEQSAENTVKAQICVWKNGQDILNYISKNDV